MDCVHFTVLDGDDEVMFVFLNVDDNFEYIEEQLEHLKKLIVVFHMAQQKSRKELLDELPENEIDLLDEVEDDYDTSENIYDFVRDYASLNDLTLADCVDEIAVLL